MRQRKMGINFLGVRRFTVTRPRTTPLPVYSYRNGNAISDSLLELDTGVKRVTRWWTGTLGSKLSGSRLSLSHQQLCVWAHHITVCMGATIPFIAFTPLADQQLVVIKRWPAKHKLKHMLHVSFSLIVEFGHNYYVALSRASLTAHNFSSVGPITLILLKA